MMKFAYRLPLFIFLGLLALFLAYLVQSGGYGRHTLTQREAPHFQIHPLGEAAPVKSTSLRGKPHLVTFFATWCHSCREEHGLLMALKSKNLLPIIGIAVRDDQAKVKAYLDKHGNPYTIVGLDENKELTGTWGVRGIPTAFLVDGQGVVRQVFRGVFNVADVEEVLATLEENAEDAGASTSPTH
ncbi:MAG: redoxin family protein [Holosporales bacterium]